MCWKKIRKMLRRKPPAGTGKRVAIVGTADDLAKLADLARAADESPPVLPAVPPRKWWQYPVRFFNPSRGGHNMPKRQPCPTCRRRSRRGQKTMGGAYYQCGLHGVFFVPAPRRGARVPAKN